jgi:hypothetical protein
MSGAIALPLSLWERELIVGQEEPRLWLQSVEAFRHAPL